MGTYDRISRTIQILSRDFPSQQLYPLMMGLIYKIILYVIYGIIWSESTSGTAFGMKQPMTKKVNSMALEQSRNDRGIVNQILLFMEY